MTKWQPIATAPTGVNVLILCEGKRDAPLVVFTAMTFGVDPGDDCGALWFVYSPDIRDGTMVEGLMWNPTHWMPLPEPPKPEGK